MGSGIPRDQRLLPRNVDGNGDGISAEDIGAAEMQPPQIAIPSNVLVYTENASPVLPTSSATLSDIDASLYGGGSLRVFVAEGAFPSLIGIQSIGDGANQLGVSGNQIKYGGVVFATWTGGSNGTPLEVAFQSTATSPRVQALIRAITFTGAGEAPPAGLISLRYELMDETGAVSSGPEVAINIVAMNDPPILSPLPVSSAYSENAVPRILAPAATLTDVDSPNFASAVLTAKFVAGGQPTDRLTVVHQGTTAGLVGVSGTTISVSGISVATFTGGTGTTPLSITFNANSWVAAAQAVLRRIGYSSASESPSTATRAIEIQTTDGDGGLSVARRTSVIVTSVPDVPRIVVGDSIDYLLGSGPIVLSPNETVTDVDSTNFASSKLTVAIVKGASTLIQIYPGGAFQYVGTDIRLNNVSVGTLLEQTSKLVVSFKNTASLTIVQQFVQGIRFRTTGAATAGLRSISFTLTDNVSGAVSIPSLKNVNVK